MKSVQRNSAETGVATWADRKNGLIVAALQISREVTLTPFFRTHGLLTKISTPQLFVKWRVSYHFKAYEYTKWRTCEFLSIIVEIVF